jgi:hypothetical protein
MYLYSSSHQTGCEYVQLFGGTYDEYVIVDLRQAFMESTTYIALKDPEKEFAEVLISAYDSCGRKCKAFCRNENGDFPQAHI